MVPEQPRSAAGLSVTLHKPIRARRSLISGVPSYLISGTTGDCVFMALHYLLDEPPKVAVSGINVGENVSLMEFFMSGTVAGAIAAALHGIPSVAFSKRVESRDTLFVDNVKPGFNLAARIASLLVSMILEEGLPRGVDLLNVNFPERMTKETEVRITRLAKLSIRSKVIARSDPRGRPYYWIWGEKFESFPEESDAHAVLREGSISITPISLGSLSASPSSVEDIRVKLKGILTEELG